MPGMSAYATSKAAVEQFANVLRLEMLPHGVDVGSAHMLWIDTDLVRDAQDDLPSFRRTLSQLPYPFGVVTSVDRCVDAFVAGIRGRRRRIFVPGSLGLISAFRQLLGSALLQRVLVPTLRPMLHDAEAEMRDVGRPFGSHSTGMGDGGAPPKG